MLIKNNGAYSPTLSTYVKSNDAWSIPRSKFVKVADTWREVVPNNCIIFYTNASQFADGKAYLADGTNGTYTLVDKYILGASTYGTTGGSLTHANHGAGTGTLNAQGGCSLNHGYKAGAVTAGHITTATYGTHTHSVPSHSHPNTGTNIPSTLSLIPTMFGDKIYTGAIIPATSQLSGAIAYVSSVVNYYIKLASTYGTSTASAHNHGSVASGNSGTGGPATENKSFQWGNGTAYTNIHRHSTTHTDVSVTPDHYYFTVVPNQVQSDIWFDELPTGSILAFTSTLLPYGWVRLSTADDRLLRTYATASLTGGTTTHSHSGSVNANSAYVASSNYYSYVQSGSTYYTLQNHTHSWTDNHSTAQNHLPPYLSFILAIKVSADIIPETRNEDTLCDLLASYVSAGAIRNCYPWTLTGISQPNYIVRNISQVGRNAGVSSTYYTQYSFTGEYSTNGGTDWTACTATTSQLAAFASGTIHEGWTGVSPRTAYSYSYKNTEIEFI